MTNSNLVTVFNGTISNYQVQLCNARSLHEFLEVKNRFNDWITDRISDYGFIENDDYIIVTERTNGRPRKEYHITLDMGKELAMVERNEKGRQIRKYFIQCEKQAQQPKQLALQAPEKKFSFELSECDLQNIGWGLFEALKMLDFIKDIYPALDKLNSRFAPTAYSFGVEYGNHLNYLSPIIHNMIKDVDFSDNPTPIRRIEEELRKPKTKYIYR